MVRYLLPFLVGCTTVVLPPDIEPAETGRLLVDNLAILDSGDVMTCGCFWQEYGYESEDACLYVNLFPITEEQSACIIHAGEAYQEFEALAQCRMSASTNRSHCYSAIEGCDLESVESCNDMYIQDADSGCAHVDPCYGLHGRSKETCENARWSLSVAVLNCVGYH